MQLSGGRASQPRSKRSAPLREAESSRPEWRPVFCVGGSMTDGSSFTPRGSRGAVVASRVSRVVRSSTLAVVDLKASSRRGRFAASCVLSRTTALDERERTTSYAGGVLVARTRPRCALRAPMRSWRLHDDCRVGRVDHAPTSGAERAETGSRAFARPARPGCRPIVPTARRGARAVRAEAVGSASSRSYDRFEVAAAATHHARGAAT